MMKVTRINGIMSDTIQCVMDWSVQQVSGRFKESSMCYVGTREGEAPSEPHFLFSKKTARTEPRPPIFVAGIALAMTLLATSLFAAETKRPNIVVIMTDDQARWAC